MNSLEALKTEIFDMFKMVINTIDIKEDEQILATIENQLLQGERYQALQKLQAIESADLSEAEISLNLLKSSAKDYEKVNTMPGLRYKFNEIPGWDIIELSLKKSKLLESKETKIKEYVIRLIKEHNNEMYMESITSDIGNTPTQEYKKRMLSYFEREQDREIKKFEALLGGESDE